MRLRVFKNITLALSGLIAATLLPMAARAGGEYFSNNSNGTNWMSYISPSAPLSQLTIPGTHESASASGVFSSEAQCQDENIDQQLNDGTRYFDFRVHDEGHGLPHALSMYHSTIYEGSYLDDCLNSIYNFLNAHPSETVLVSIAGANGTSNQIANDVSGYIQSNYSKWYFGGSCPTLGQVRGKIVLFNRYGYQSDGSKIGINCNDTWQDNQGYFDADYNHFNGGPDLYVQDWYEPGSPVNPGQEESNKWGAIWSQLNRAYYDNNMYNFYINFFSIAWQVGNTVGVYSFAVDMDAGLKNICKNTLSPGRYGVICVDYSNWQVAQDIWTLNWGPFGQQNVNFSNCSSGISLNGGTNRSPGSFVNQWVWSGSPESWTLWPLGGGLYGIMNEFSGNFLDVYGYSSNNGGAIDTWSNNGSVNQKWKLQADTAGGSGTWDIVSLYNGKVVEDRNWGQGNGAAVDQWDWVGGSNQRWALYNAP